MINQEELIKLLKENFYYDLILTLLGEDENLFLVGGFLRDLALGKVNTKDLDLSVQGNALKIARHFADKVNGSFVLLDEKEKIGRVVVKNNGYSTSFDFANLKGRDLIRDINKRDFTINTICFDFKESILKDLLGGLEDVKKQVIKVVSKQTFREDPLRMLRAVRLSAALNFKLHPKTEDLIKQQNRLITTVSGERIRDELIKILNVKDSHRHILFLQELGLLFQVMPQLKLTMGVTQDGYHRYDVWKHSLLTLRTIENILEKEIDSFGQTKEKIIAHLENSTAGERKRKHFLKLACLIHDVGKPQSQGKGKNGRITFIGHDKEGLLAAEGICHYLKFSAKEEKTLKSLVKNHMRPIILAGEKVLTKRAIYRLFHDLEDNVVELLLLSLADALSGQGELMTKEIEERHRLFTVRMLEEYYFEVSVSVRPEKIVSGKDLIDLFQLEAGPFIGYLLGKVQEAQGERKITTKEEALVLVKQIIAAKPLPEKKK